MIGYGNKALLHFPKIERYEGGMVFEIKRSMYELLRMCIECDEKYHKKTTYREMKTTVLYIQSMIGIAANNDHKYISVQKYGNWSKYLDELFKMICSRERAAER